MLLAVIVHLLDPHHLLLLLLLLPGGEDGLLSAPWRAGDLLLCGAPAAWGEGLVGRWRRRGEDVGCAGEEDRGALWVDIVGDLVVLERRLGRAGDGYRRRFCLSAATSRGRSQGERSQIGEFERPFPSFHGSMWISGAWRDGCCPVWTRCWIVRI